MCGVGGRVKRVREILSCVEWINPCLGFSFFFLLSFTASFLKKFELNLGISHSRALSC